MSQAGEKTSMTSFPAASGFARRIASNWLAVLIACSAAFCLLRAVRWTDRDRLLREAERALHFEKYHDAEELANAVLKESPGDSQALLVAGEAAAGLQESFRAMAYFERVQDDGSPASTQAKASLGERLLREGQLWEAEKNLREALREDPGHFQANKNLVLLLQLQARTWESLPFVKELIRQGQFRGDELQMLTLTEMMFVSDPVLIANYKTARPGDPLPLLGEARKTLLRNDVERSEELLRKIVADYPDLIEAEIRLQQILLQSGRLEEFAERHHRLSSDAERHPEVWVTRGNWAQQQGLPEGATRCFLEALKRSPNHVYANYQLSLLFREVGEQSLAERFAARADLLSKLELEMMGMINSPRLRGMQRAADLMEQLGRDWEAAGMYDVAVRVFADDLEWAREGVKRCRQKILADGGFIAREAHPLNGIEISRYSIPGVFSPSDKVPQDSGSRAEGSQVAFVDVAKEVGLEFSYFNGSKTPKGLEHIFETTGGGIAVLDYDGNSWPDLYFAQGGMLPPRTDDFTYRDRLFRNLGNGRFEEVMLQAGVGDHLFGQGVTVGDFNNDGFPDLYVANIGENRFYENNGDGTFTDVTAQTGTAGNEWTLSCLLADLNGDTLPDVYAVNYLTIQSVLEQRCRKNGHPLTCAPTMFPAEQDRVYLNRGNGKFEEVTDRCGVVHSEGKGLGLVAGDFDGTRRLSLFVGNDTTTNFFYANQTPARGGELRFAETGLLTGLGVDHRGRAQATMGIAAGDADGDGLIDLFATNFYADANTLYIQKKGQVFADETRRAGLHDSSFNLLGFGTQFLDAELDGFPDLVLVNGHVDRTAATGEPDEMPPQFYRNLGTGRFAELPASSLGPFFEQKSLGRSLVRLDWNGDGKEDFCAGHLHSPAALLTNETPEAGHFLAVCLSGVESDRDAIGTTVRVRTQKGTYVQQLTAGDGYMASNQRQLVFGLGAEGRVSELSIAWPSGKDQIFRDLEVDRRIMCIEGSVDLIELPRPGI